MIEYKCPEYESRDWYINHRQKVNEYKQKKLLEV